MYNDVYSKIQNDDNDKISEIIIKNSKMMMKNNDTNH